MARILPAANLSKSNCKLFAVSGYCRRFSLNYEYVIDIHSEEKEKKSTLSYQFILLFGYRSRQLCLFILMFHETCVIIGILHCAQWKYNLLQLVRVYFRTLAAVMGVHCAVRDCWPNIHIIGVSMHAHVLRWKRLSNVGALHSQWLIDTARKVHLSYLCVNSAHSFRSIDKHGLKNFTAKYNQTISGQILTHKSQSFRFRQNVNCWSLLLSPGAKLTNKSCLMSKTDWPLSFKITI